MKPIQTTLRTSSTKFDIPSSLTIPANKQRFVPGSGSYPKGFRVGSIKAGIKPASNLQPDLVLVTSEIPASGAAVFTKNEFPAASVTVSRELLRRTKGEGFRGAIANSGCANTLTGLDGLNDARAMSREVERCIFGGGGRGEDDDDDASSSSIMVMHTGIGSQRLPISNILQNIPSLYKDTGNTHTHWLNAAWGLCTTDTFPKLASRTFTLPSFPDTLFSIAGLTKGSGMVHPNMATTLGIICTDAPITPVALRSLLSTAVDKSYNCISIDGDTSTNDMVVMFANGAAVSVPSATSSNLSNSSSNQKIIDISQPQSTDFLVLQEILTSLTTSMSHLVVRDAEGASKFITVRIRNSPSRTAGKYIASSIARSSLIKTAFYGEDPTTWAGVLATLGHSLLDTEFEGRGIIVPEMTSIWFVDSDGDTERKVLKVLDKSVPGRVDEERIKDIMAREDLEVVVDLRDGENVEGDREGDEAVYWTSDLTHEFVSINSGVAR